MIDSILIFVGGLTVIGVGVWAATALLTYLGNKFL